MFGDVPASTSAGGAQGSMTAPLPAFWGIQVDCNRVMQNMPVTTSGSSGGELPSPLPEHGSRRAMRKAARQASEVLSAQAESEWNLFADLPGKHLLYQRTGWNSWVWINVSTRNEEMTSVYNGIGPKPKTISHQGGRYGWQRDGRRKVLAENRVKNLIDLSTGSVLLRRSGQHFNGADSTTISLARTVYSFPVMGRPSHALMAAIDDKGRRVVTYRVVNRKRSQTEIVIPPESLTIPGIHLLVAVTSELMIHYFNHPSAG